MIPAVERAKDRIAAKLTACIARLRPLDCSEAALLEIDNSATYLLGRIEKIERRANIVPFPRRGEMEVKHV